MILFFDTETNGLPKNWRASMKDLDNWPRVIQLAFILFEDDGTIVQEFCELIQPDGWEIPVQKFWIENGYSTEKNQAEGIRIEEALIEFLQAYQKSDLLVAHNISFDFNIVGAELIRKGLAAEKRLPKFCTMKSSTNICKLPSPRGYKWPKLMELHEHLFGEGFDDAHDALEDVRATGRCFFEMASQGLIEIPTLNP